jgi:hypothetical protein
VPRGGNNASAKVRNRKPVGAASWILPLLAAAGAAGCAGYVEQQRRQEAEIKEADAALDRDRIMVQTGDLALPYEQLGSLEYAEPFSGEANDEKHIDEKLRTMAIEKWGNQVDAIIWVKSALSSDAIRVSADAVRVKGDCSFCRHQGGYPQGR